MCKVCPPGLHITLGRLFDLLEDECHDLDQQMTTTTSSRQSTFEKYMEAKTSLRQLEQDKSTLADQIKTAQQYLVLHLLTAQDPTQSAVVQSTACTTYYR